MGTIRQAAAGKARCHAEKPGDFMPFAVTRFFLATAFAAVLGGLALPAMAQTVIYDATGGAENGGDSIKSGGINLYDRVYNPASATLASITLNLKAAKSDLGVFDVVVAPVDKTTGKPGKPMVVAQLSDNKLSTSFALKKVTPSSPVKLEGGTYYFVGVAMHPHGRISVVLGNSVDAAVRARPSVAAGANYYNPDGGIQANAGGPYEISVAVTQ